MHLKATSKTEPHKPFHLCGESTRDVQMGMQGIAESHPELLITETCHFLAIHFLRSGSSDNDITMRSMCNS